MNRYYLFIAGRANHRCEYCQVPEFIFHHRFDVEHIVPQSDGGVTHTDNLALACSVCNTFKSDHQSGWDEESGNTFRLFDPRQDKWSDHFYMDLESGTIQGIDALGRVTVNCLHMNADLAIRARLLWIEKGLFP